MKVFVILLVLVGFTSSVFAFEPAYTDYFSNPAFQKYSIIAENYRYEIPYDMSAGIIESMKIECKWTILTINIQSNDNGDLTIHLPRSLIDSKSGTSSDDVFIVLLDGKEIAFEEGTDSASRTLKIPFEQDTSIIKIIGVNYPEHSGYNACNGKHNPPYSYWFPPLKQIQSGISFDEIQCQENLVLIQKYDGSPACVTEQTKTKLIERGWAGKDDSISKTSKDCMTIKQSKQIAPFFKTPTYLPEGYSHVCSQSGTPFESYAVYHNKEVFVGWIGKKHLLIDEGAIFIYQIDERNMIGDKKFQTYGSPEQRTRETYDSVIEGNPSLNPQLITINGMLAYAVDSCPDCGMQTANFTDGSSIQESTSTKTRIKFIDDNGVNYMLETTLPLSELIKVAESLQ